MKTIIVLLATLLIASANLGKSTRWNGLDGLNIQKHYGSIGYKMHEINDHSGCDENQCTNKKASHVYQVNYNDGHNIHICTCPNAVIGKDEIAHNFGYVPAFIRKWTDFITSGSPNICVKTGAAAYSTGASTTFCQSGMAPSVYVHEATHNYDFRSGGLSSRQEWRDAVNSDSCVPDSYADVNLVEDFAQNAVVWMYISKVSDNISCMQNQMNAFESWIP